jgi:hypothetical protein
MPDAITTVTHDVKADIQLSVGALGKLKVGDIAGKADVAARSIFEKYPNLDRLVALQTMAATYCSMLRDSKLADVEKISRWETFQAKVLDLNERTRSGDEGGRIKVRPQSDSKPPRTGDMNIVGSTVSGGPGGQGSDTKCGDGGPVALQAGPGGNVNIGPGTSIKGGDGSSCGDGGAVSINAGDARR